MIQNCFQCYQIFTDMKGIVSYLWVTSTLKKKTVLSTKTNMSLPHQGKFFLICDMQQNNPHDTVNTLYVCGFRFVKQKQKMHCQFTAVQGQFVYITLFTYYVKVKIETKLYEKGKYTHFHCLSLPSLNELCNSILCDHGKGVKERKNTQFH